MCPKLNELLSWNGPTVHVWCFMLARASTKTFISRIHIRQPSPKNSEKNLRQPKNSLAGSLVSRGITVYLCLYYLFISRRRIPIFPVIPYNLSSFSADKVIVPSRRTCPRDGRRLTVFQKNYNRVTNLQYQKKVCCYTNSLIIAMVYYTKIRSVLHT